MSDGCLAVNLVTCPRDIVAEIANVTTRHFIVSQDTAGVRIADNGITYDTNNVKLDLVSLAEFGRVSMALSGPTSKGMPSLSTVSERYPVFGKTKVSIYAKGKVVQTGYSSPEQALFCAHDFIREFNLQFKTRLRVFNFRVINIVAIVKANRTVNCPILKQILGAQCVYEDPKVMKKLFGKKGYSGAIVSSTLVREDKKRKPKMVIFPTGIAVLMGCQNRSEIGELTREFFGYLDKVDIQTNERRLVVGKSDASVTTMTAEQLLDAAYDILKLYDSTSRNGR
jgi:TATA-box binding protein (TBP) (component of TFIID and TFIIIB)